jgi:hypothetical protein
MPSTAPGVFGEFSCIVARRRTVAEIELDGCVVLDTGVIAGKDKFSFLKIATLVSLN